MKKTFLFIFVASFFILALLGCAKKNVIVQNSNNINMPPSQSNANVNQVAQEKIPAGWARYTSKLGVTFLYPLTSLGGGSEGIPYSETPVEIKVVEKDTSYGSVIGIGRAGDVNADLSISVDKIPQDKTATSLIKEFTDKQIKGEQNCTYNIAETKNNNITYFSVNETNAESKEVRCFYTSSVQTDYKIYKNRPDLLINIRWLQDPFLTTKELQKIQSSIEIQ